MKCRVKISVESDDGQGAEIDQTFIVDQSGKAGIALGMPYVITPDNWRAEKQVNAPRMLSGRGQTLTEAVVDWIRRQYPSGL